MAFKPISERAISSFPLSIGTGLAFESVFNGRLEPYDTTRVLPDRIDLLKYNSSYINVFTLYRNMVGSLTPVDLRVTSIDDLVEALLLEIDIIQSLFSREGGGVITPSFYIMSYQKVWDMKWAKNVLLKHPNTPNQKDFHSRWLKVSKSIQSRMDIKTYDSEIVPDRSSKTFILTHMSIDLTSSNRFSQLDLLESNTGKIKIANQWCSKFNKTNGEYVYNIPFSKLTLVLFGDRNIIKPYSNKIRNQILDIAKARHWTSATTISKVKLDLSVSILDPYLNKIISEI